jgi:hypothetical protein
MAKTDRAFRALARDSPRTVLALLRLVAPGIVAAQAQAAVVVVLEDPNLDPPAHPREADFAALVGEDAISHVEFQGYRDPDFDRRVFDYHLALTLRHATRRVQTCAIWMRRPDAGQRAAVVRRGALQLERAVVVLPELQASLLLSCPETACFAPAAELGDLHVDELCDRVVAALLRPGASSREPAMAGVAAATRGRYLSLVSAMERAKMEPLIIEDLVDFGYDQGLEEGRVEGRAEESARAVLRVLEVRGVPVDAAFVARVRACADLQVLDRWFQRAVVVARAEDVLAEG